MSNILETIPNHTFIFHNQGTEAPSLTDKYSSTDFVIMYGDAIASGANLDGVFGQDANGLVFGKYTTGDNVASTRELCVFPHECVNFGSDDFTLSYWAKFDLSSSYEYIFGFAFNAANSIICHTKANAAGLYVYDAGSVTGTNFSDEYQVADNTLTNFIVSRSGDEMHFYMNGVKFGDIQLATGVSLPTPATSYNQNNNLYTIGSLKPRKSVDHNGFNLYRTDIWKNLGITTQSEIDKIYAQGIYEQFNKILLEKENVDIEISKNFIINKTS